MKFRYLSIFKAHVQNLSSWHVLWRLKGVFGDPSCKLQSQNEALGIHNCKLEARSLSSWRSTTQNGYPRADSYFKIDILEPICKPVRAPSSQFAIQNTKMNVLEPTRSNGFLRADSFLCIDFRIKISTLGTPDFRLWLGNGVGVGVGVELRTSREQQINLRELGVTIVVRVYSGFV